MITAVDTSVLIDVFTADRVHGSGSAQALRRCLAQGSLIVGDLVLAETAAVFPDGQAALRVLGSLGVEYVPPSRRAALAAGEAWRSYRTAGGSRTRVVADFLIGAHAAEHADRLLTRDRGFFRRYFASLVVVDPSEPSRPTAPPAR